MNASLKSVFWKDSKEDLLKVRYSVFVDEQGVPVEIEQDEMDPQADHVLLTIDEKPVGTGRLLLGGYIGRVAVLKQYRGHGLGAQIMDFLAGIADKKGCKMLKLSSQVHAQEFYLKLGYEIEGETYIEAGIPHVRMSKNL